MLFNTKEITVDISKSYKGNFDFLIGHFDTLKFLKTMPDESVNLVVSSPPYNIGKSYENREQFKDYLEVQKEVIGECNRVLKPSGSFCWQIGNYIEKGEVYPLDIYYYDIFKFDLGMKLRNRIIWHFGHGLHAKNRLSGRYETLLWFTKTDEYTFNLDPIRVPSKYPGKRHFKGEKKDQPSGNPKGKNPSDIWEILVNDFDSCLWDIPNVKSNHPEKTTHPCQYPIELIERLVLAMTNEGDVVLDPYMGVGSAPLAALIHNRKAIGIDKEKEYVELAIDRANSLKEGTLRKRKLGQPVFKPTGKEKVAQVPSEWSKKTNQGNLL